MCHKIRASKTAARLTNSSTGTYLIILEKKIVGIEI